MIQADRDTDATGNNLEAEYRMIAADESVVWVRDQANLVRASDGTPLYWHGIMMDITRQRNAEGRVLEVQNRFQTLVEQMPAAIYLESIGDQKHMLYVSPQIEKVLGYQIHQWLSIPNFWDTVIHPDDRDWVAAADRTSDAHGTRFHHEYRAVAADGRTVWLRDESILIRNTEGEPLHWQGVLVDVTDSKAAEAALTHQATHDALTDLPNRALLHDRVQQAVLHARRHNQHLALLLLDLNRFKEVNDTLGHHMGDMLLRQIAYRLCDAVRESDTVARLGGDEFAILLPETDHAGAATIAKKIRAVLDAPFGLEGHVFDVGASIGCAVYPNHGEDVSTLLRRADVAMYVAKRHGRDFVVYVAEDDRNNATRLILVRELRSAIENHELSLHYQPLVDPQHDNVRRVEALARWPHPARDMVPPSLFVPLAEETGLIRPLTQWVLGTAAKQAHMWRSQGIDLAIAVNISARSLHDPELVSVVAGLLDQYGVPPASLAIEITESAIIVDPEHAHRTLTELHDMGLPIAIDDFGTGYSSLAHLKRLPIDEIKIDRAFVGDMVTNADNAFIVRSIIDLAHNLDMQIVAEGVENQATLEMLLDMGCDLIQGYYISPPVAANALHSWLDHQEQKIG